MGTFGVIACVAAIHGGISVWWQSYKKKHAALPTPMKLRKGVYVPWGPVQRIQRVLGVLIWIYMAWLALIGSILLYGVIFR